jgi:hypothetical protein
MEYDINTVVVEPFESGDRVDVCRHYRYEDCKTTTGTVIKCVKDRNREYSGPALWMVNIELDNGKKIGVRPAWVDLIKETP